MVRTIIPREMPVVARKALTYEVVQRGHDDGERGMDLVAGTDPTLFEVDDKTLRPGEETEG